MLSLGKLLVLALVVLAVIAAAKMTRRRAGLPVDDGMPPGRVRHRSKVVDLVRNPRTGTYEPRDGE